MACFVLRVFIHYVYICYIELNKADILYGCFVVELNKRRIYIYVWVKHEQHPARNIFNVDIYICWMLEAVRRPAFFIKIKKAGRVGQRLCSMYDIYDIVYMFNVWYNIIFNGGLTPRPCEAYAFKNFFLFNMELYIYWMYEQIFILS